MKSISDFNENSKRTITLEDLAKARGLRIDILKTLGWRDHQSGVAIPCPTADGSITYHIRRTIERNSNEPQWLWENYNTNTILPYGANFISQWISEGKDTIVITESEIDWIALYTHGIPALATYGASQWKERYWELLRNFKKVIVWIEDTATTKLLSHILDTKPNDLEYPEVFTCHSLDYKAKDPARLLIRYNPSILQTILSKSVKVKRIESYELLDTVIKHLNAKRGSNYFTAHCPFHDDENPSFSIFLGFEGDYLFKCHASSCGVEGTLELLGAVLGYIVKERKNTLTNRTLTETKQQQTTQEDKTQKITSLIDEPTDYLHTIVVVEALKDRVRWISEGKFWMVYANGIWERVKDDAGLETLVMNTLIDYYATRIQQTTDYEEKKKHIENLRKILNKHKITPVISLMKSYTPDLNKPPILDIKLEEFDKHSELLNTPNGVVELRTGRLLEHKAEYMLTKRTRVSYNPNADCPLFRKFLNEIFNNNEEMVRFVIRLLGYTLLGDNRERVFIIFYGKGANGKTVLTEIVEWVLGDYATETPPETFLSFKEDGFKPRNDIARLQGVRFVASSETKDGSTLDTALVKRLTGGDTLTARYLYSEYFTFKPQFTPILRTNYKPQARGDDKAIWDRLLLIPFTVSIPPEKQDRTLVEKLKKEGEGILNLLVKGCMEYLQLGELRPPREVLTATAQYRMDTDSIWRFLQEETEQDNNAKIKASELYSAYEKWMREVEGAIAESNTKFGKYIENIGYERIRLRDGKYYKGLKLKNQTQQTQTQTQQTQNTQQNTQQNTTQKTEPKSTIDIEFLL